MEKLKTIIKKLLIITLSFCLTANTALANAIKKPSKMHFSGHVTITKIIYPRLFMIININYILFFTINMVVCFPFMMHFI